MKYPDCEKEDKKSSVYVGITSSTAMHCPSYYDEDGRLHSHDQNTTHTAYKCSNGHEWSEKYKGKCWCGE
jgi:hypothetical protein